MVRGRSCRRPRNRLQSGHRTSRTSAVRGRQRHGPAHVERLAHGGIELAAARRLTWHATLSAPAEWHTPRRAAERPPSTRAARGPAAARRGLAAGVAGPFLGNCAAAAAPVLRVALEDESPHAGALGRDASHGRGQPLASPLSRLAAAWAARAGGLAVEVGHTGPQDGRGPSVWPPPCAAPAMGERGMSLPERHGRSGDSRLVLVVGRGRAGRRPLCALVITPTRHAAGIHKKIMIGRGKVLVGPLARINNLWPMHVCSQRLPVPARLDPCTPACV